MKATVSEPLPIITVDVGKGIVLRCQPPSHHICTGTGLTPATSAPGLGSPGSTTARDYSVLSDGPVYVVIPNVEHVDAAVLCLVRVLLPAGASVRAERLGFRVYGFARAPRLRQ